MKAPVNTKTRKPENAKTGGINLWTRKRRKRENGENGENKKTAKTGKTRKRRKPENAKTAKTAKSVPVFWFSISRFLVFSVFSVFWFSRFLVFSLRWPHPSGQVAFFMCLVIFGLHPIFWVGSHRVVLYSLSAMSKHPQMTRCKTTQSSSKNSRFQPKPSYLDHPVFSTSLVKARNPLCFSRPTATTKARLPPGAG